MFDRRSKPTKQKTFATGAAIFVIAGVFTTPVLAATSARISCPEAVVATLEVPLHILAPEFTNHDTWAVPSADDDAIEKLEFASSSSLLAPRAEAAIRKVFSPSNAVPMAGTDSEPASDSDEGVETDSAMTTRLPGVSDDDFLRYRKQMYRRDI